ncbi:hypothetical protein O3M35_003477 [Rhynocoris fuscipes]|uniref:Uncharacterized protein n=1 Tax=Rhynocoris fuscipes TaxID=488301 RepID=A0AAW1CJ24_9HEMI
MLKKIARLRCDAIHQLVYHHQEVIYLLAKRAYKILLIILVLLKISQLGVSANQRY